MEISEADAWITVEHSVRDRFRTMSLGDGRGYTERLQYAVFPSFTDYRQLDILSSKKTRPAFAFRTTWDCDGDRAALSTLTERPNNSQPFEPSITTVELDVDANELDAIVTAFEAVSLPLLPSYASGLDGTSYELQLGTSSGWCRFRWWQQLPDEWKPMESLIGRLHGALSARSKTGEYGNYF